MNLQNNRIDRVALVRRHNPKLYKADMNSPLTVGNGEFAYTADVTGMQSLYREYEEEGMPLCTMAQWGWHTTPFSEGQYTCQRTELVETEYDYCGRKVYYPVKCVDGNERVYHWLRQNPHKCNLVRIGLVECTEAGYEEWRAGEIRDICQELHMEQGCLESRFQRKGEGYHLHTLCAGGQDILGFSVVSQALAAGRTGVLLAFPYGSPHKSGADWSKPEAHSTVCRRVESTRMTTDWEITHIMNREVYLVRLHCEQPADMVEVGAHCFLLKMTDVSYEELEFTVRISRVDMDVRESSAIMPGQKAQPAVPSYPEVVRDARAYWTDFWQRTGVIQLSSSRDARALELERRIVLSQYLMAVNCAGSMPPQETGLTCNSWYGKAHLEMYFWHEAYLPLYGRTDLLLRSMDWFVEHLPEARDNATKNGYKGARWTKMVGEDGLDSPSKIAPLLVWQQPHLIYMIYLAYCQSGDKSLLEKYYALIEESAIFMADFAVRNSQGQYELVAPLIPVQERHAPQTTRNPVFEVEYWVEGLRLAARMGTLLGKQVPELWLEVAEHMIPSPQQDGYYVAHSNCPQTFQAVSIDHPSMLMAYGVIDSGRMEPQVMERTLEKVLETWDEQSLWGWDFAVMAMTAVRLGKPHLAIELLLKDTYKNVYVASGNNRQISRDDLPLYLPGNGSLLLAAAMMTAGYEGCREECPGFPKDGSWTVEYEGIGRVK